MSGTMSRSSSSRWVYDNLEEFVQPIYQCVCSFVGRRLGPLFCRASHLRDRRIDVEYSGERVAALAPTIAARSELLDRGVGHRDPHSQRTEVDERSDAVFDTDYPA